MRGDAVCCEGVAEGGKGSCLLKTCEEDAEAALMTPSAGAGDEDVNKNPIRPRATSSINRWNISILRNLK